MVSLSFGLLAGLIFLSPGSGFLKNRGGGEEAAAEGKAEARRRLFLIQALERSQPSEVWFHQRGREARGRMRTPG